MKPIDFVDKIISLTENVGIINSKMDDYYKELTKKHPSKNNTSSYDYGEAWLLAFVEDINSFCSDSIQGLILYFTMLDEYDESKFSPRYAFNNSIHFTIGAYEKLIYVLSIYYKVDFDENPRRNSPVNLYRKLKRNQDFNGSYYHTNISRIHEYNYLNHIFEFRKYNDHDLSKHFESLQKYLESEEIHLTPDENLMDWINSIIEIVDVVLKSISYFIDEITDYTFIKEATIELSKELIDNIFIDESFIFDYYNNLNEINMNQMKDFHTRIGEYIFNDLEKLFLSHNISNYKVVILLGDAIHRLSENIRSFGMMYESMNHNIQERFNVSIHLLTPEYFIYTSLFRSYSIYDKLAKLLNLHYGLEIERKIYFSNTVDKICEKANTSLSMKLLDVLNSDHYIMMDYLRNRLLHLVNPANVRPKDIFLPIMISTIYANIEYQMEIIKLIISELEGN